MARSRSAWGVTCVMTAVFAAGCVCAPQASQSMASEAETAGSFVTTRLDHSDRIPAGQTVVIEFKSAAAESLNGMWMLRVSDNTAQDTGYIDSWSVMF